MTVTIANPYSQFPAYWDAGWRGILPLPHGKKTWPPDGYTGHTGIEPSYPDCQAWSETGPRNLALRLPPDTIGLDVDHYEQKTGGHTLSQLVAKHGPLPPTVISSSRGDGISGIRLYRVPPGHTLLTKLDSIELIQHHHRYVVAWPSLHPNGGTYQWIDERTGQTLTQPPHHDTIPHLPQAWLHGLTTSSSEHPKTGLTAEQGHAMLAAMPSTEPPCQHIHTHAGKALTGGDRHDSYNEAVLAVTGAGWRGCPGAPATLQRLRAAFIAEVTSAGNTQRTQGEAEAEWRRSILGALQIIASEPQGHTCPDDLLTWLPNPEQPAADPSPFDKAVAKRVAELQINETAQQTHATLKLGATPPLTGHTLPELLTQTDEDEQYRIQDLWPAEGRVLCPAAAKTGKTTLIVNNLIPALVDGTPFLGTLTTSPLQRRLMYINLEVSARTIRRWFQRHTTNNPEKITILNLRGTSSALTLNTPAGRERVATYLRDQDTEIVILDPLAPLLAAHGLDENLNRDIALFFAWWSETLNKANVADDLITHHIGHNGERSRGASRLLDEPDAIWTMTRQTTNPDDNNPFGPTETRYLKAIGRDVDMPEQALGYNPDTGQLTLNGTTRTPRAATRIAEAILAYVTANEGCSKTDVKRNVDGNNALIWSTISQLITQGRLDETWHQGQRLLTVPR